MATWQSRQHMGFELGLKLLNSVCLCLSIHVKRYLMDRLNESHFSFKCPMNLEDMQATARGRFCGKCQKEVFDLTHCSLDEVRALEQKHGPLCGSIRMAQVATVAISLAAAACQEKPISVGVGEIAVPPSHHKNTESTPPQPTAGSICLPPVPQDGKTSATNETSGSSVRGRIQMPLNQEKSNPTPPSE